MAKAMYSTNSTQLVSFFLNDPFSAFLLIFSAHKDVPNFPLLRFFSKFIHTNASHSNMQNYSNKRALRYRILYTLSTSTFHFFFLHFFEWIFYQAIPLMWTRKTVSQLRMLFKFFFLALLLHSSFPILTIKILFESHFSLINLNMVFRRRGTWFVGRVWFFVQFHFFFVFSKCQNTFHDYTTE